MKKVLDKLNWRYATKVFNPSKNVSKEDLNILLEAARLSASSYGLQPYHFFVIEDNEVRSKLRKASWNQSQITDASYLLVLANKPTFDDSLVDNYIDNIIETRGVSKKDLEGYSQMMKSTLLGLPDAQKNSWTSDQTYIALGNLMTIAAEMEIDTCPMEGFDKAQYNEILGLNDKNLSASVVLAVGYRADDDETQNYPKVRYSKEQIITHI
ncbi:Nitroreductase [Maribacter orientalis]|uniref:Nitroreductase n=1 Tax=Maribacter orientalis TaxID=228957 RepID=A0A1H7WUK5_9FLAO|nr:NAD(P)H-dependent oxidoreductase [Maribacter orientalis]SEM25290.1 Nitroreductase [Maribacter orientalis]|tara:strand:- start:781 stop:1413 length:633 start_codon:yes stop_codon:yes gene_type:complete